MASMQKHIERWTRRAFIGSLGLLRGRRSDGREIGRLDAPRILLIRHDRIGDAIVSTPVMRLLRERFPDARIDILLDRYRIRTLVRSRPLKCRATETCGDGVDNDCDDQLDSVDPECP